MKKRADFSVRILLFFVCLASRESTRILSLGKVHMPLPPRFENEITKRSRVFLGCA